LGATAIRLKNSEDRIGGKLKGHEQYWFDDLGFQKKEALTGLVGREKSYYKTE